MLGQNSSKINPKKLLQKYVPQIEKPERKKLKPDLPKLPLKTATRQPPSQKVSKYSLLDAEPVPEPTFSKPLPAEPHEPSLQKLDLSLSIPFPLCRKSPAKVRKITRRCRNRLGHQSHSQHSESTPSRCKENVPNIFLLEPLAAGSKNSPSSQLPTLPPLQPKIRIELHAKPTHHSPNPINFSLLFLDPETGAAHRPTENFMTQPQLKLMSKTMSPSLKPRAAQTIELPEPEKMVPGGRYGESTNLKRFLRMRYNPRALPGKRSRKKANLVRLFFGRRSTIKWKLHFYSSAAKQTAAKAKKVSRSFNTCEESSAENKAAADQNPQDKQKKWEALREKIHKVSSIIASTGRSVIIDTAAEQRLVKDYLSANRVKLYQNSVIFDLSKAAATTKPL